MFYSVTYCLSDDSSLEAILQDVEEFAEDLAGAFESSMTYHDKLCHVLWSKQK